MSSIAAPTQSKMIGQRELVVMIALLMSLNAMAIDAMLPAVDEMARELGAADGNRRQYIVAFYLLANGIGCLFPGVFADKFGRRPMVLLALAGYGLFSTISIFVHDFDLLLVVRILQGLVAGGLMVVPTAVIRDQFEGDKMARIMSLVAAVFITVPVIAPSFGQAILLVANWRWIFAALAVIAGLAAIWVYFRLPETLHDESRQDIHLPTVMRNMSAGLFHRGSIGYVLGSALLVGAVFGYINSAQQLLGEHFGVGAWFPVVFGGTAAMMAVANIVNSRIVERYGARRVSHAGVLMYIAVSLAQIWASHAHPADIYWFAPLMAINLGLLGFLGANFGSIAMQPFAGTAGAASSAQTFVRMFGAALAGMVIGQAYDGTAQPFAYALLLCSVLALLLVLFSERGKLFRRLYKPQRHEPSLR